MTQDQEVEVICRGEADIPLEMVPSVMPRDIYEAKSRATSHQLASDKGPVHDNPNMERDEATDIRASQPLGKSDSELHESFIISPVADAIDDQPYKAASGPSGQSQRPNSSARLAASLAALAQRRAEARQMREVAD